MTISRSSRPRAICVDTRQQNGKHELKHGELERMGYTLVRSKLHVGDYAFFPSIAVDTKADIYELAADIDQQHERFKREQLAAVEDGTILVVLTENTDGITDLETLAKWREPDRHLNMRVRKSGNLSARRIEGARLAKACATMSKARGVVFAFCAPDETARCIAGYLEGGA